MGPNTIGRMGDDCLGCRVRSKFVCPLDAEQLCEFDACAVHPTLDGSDRARANSGSFVIRKTRGCHEDQGLTLFDRSVSCTRSSACGSPQRDTANARTLGMSASNASRNSAESTFRDLGQASRHQDSDSKKVPFALQQITSHDHRSEWLITSIRNQLISA